MNSETSIDFALPTPDLPGSDRGGVLSRYSGPLALLIPFLCLYALNWRTTLIGDSQAHLLQAASLAWSGDYCLDEYRDLLLKNFGGHLPYFVIESGDHLRSIYNYLPAVLLAPVFKIAPLFFGEAFKTSPAMWGLAGKLVASLLALGSGCFLWVLLSGRVRPAVAWLALGAFWFGSPLWPTSIDYLQHQPLIFFKLAALAALWGRGDSRNGRHFFLGGLCLALAVLSRYQAVFSAAVIAGFVLWRLRPVKKNMLQFIAGGALMIPPTLLYHRLAFGSVFAIGPIPYFALDFPLLKGFASLLVNPSKGLFIHSPWALLCGVLLLRSWWRKSQPAPATRRLALPLSLAALPPLILYAKIAGWYGGWTWGYRYLLDILPELIVLFALAADGCWESRALKSLARALVLLACGVQAVGALTYDHQWHQIHDLGFGPRQRWLWQVRNSQILFSLRRGLIYGGSTSRQWWDNPYQTRGLYPLEDWGGRPYAWTAREARFLYLARSDSPQLKILAPPADDSQAPQPLRGNLWIDNRRLKEFIIMPGAWQDLPLPIPVQHSAMVRIVLDRTYREKSGGRQLGIAVEAGNIALVP